MGPVESIKLLKWLKVAVKVVYIMSYYIIPSTRRCVYIYIYIEREREMFIYIHTRTNGRDKRRAAWKGEGILAGLMSA